MPNKRIALSRRKFLRSAAGAAVALPFMESLAGSKTTKPPQRFAIYYVPIGVVRSKFFPGEEKVKVPKFAGANTKQVQGKKYSPGWQELKFTETLEPLKKVKDKVSLITGLNRTFQDGTDVHAQCGSCFLTSAVPYSVKGSAWPLKRTLDHIIADQVGGTTPFRTLEFSCNSHKDNKESMYFDNISWYGTGHVAPSMRDPRKAYRRLFGMENSKSFRDVTDLVLEDARYMKKQLSHTDKQKFEEYFDSIRTIEQQVAKLEAMKGSLSKVKLELPVESYIPRKEYISLMSDIMILALQTNLTNVATMMIGPERWDTPYKFEGLFKKPMSHHQMSHNQHKFQPELAKIDKLYMQTFATLIEKMGRIEEADGSSLLDNTVLTYGSGLGDGATHQYNDLPIIIAGSKKFKKGAHLHCAKGTPLANLWLSQAQMFGYNKRFADSSAPLTQIFG